jgi:thioredoxin 1
MNSSRLGAALLFVLMGIGLMLFTPAIGLSAEPETPVLLDFYADWCGPCQGMTATVESLVQAGYSVQRINIDQQPDLARQYGVGTIPCFVVVESGREVDRVTGSTTIERLKFKLKTKERKPADKTRAPNQPSPAWRYESPTGCRAAVVRIYCQDNVRSTSIGSGVVVKWGERILVLTARHVVQDAVKYSGKIVVEFFTGKKQQVHVLKADATWDCAILELEGKADGIPAVEVELGDAAMQKPGDRLESCGYGPDGKLACNSGLFLGYKRSGETPNGPDDWMAISGHARGGDSGGPIFNKAGHVVGVLWGTNGSEVIGVQAGRIHVLLDAAVPEPYVQRQFLVRQPTAPKQPACQPGSDCCPAYSGPMPGPEPDSNPQCAIGSGISQKESLRQIVGRKPIPTPQISPPPGDGDLRRDVKSIDAKMGVLIEQRQPPASGESQPETDASPLVAGLCILGGLLVGAVVAFTKRKK